MFVIGGGDTVTLFERLWKDVKSWILRSGIKKTRYSKYIARYLHCRTYKGNSKLGQARYCSFSMVFMIIKVRFGQVWFIFHSFYSINVKKHIFSCVICCILSLFLGQAYLKNGSFPKEMNAIFEQSTSNYMRKNTISTKIRRYFQTKLYQCI